MLTLRTDPPPACLRAVFAMFAFPFTLFVGAFLLFALQPLVGKYVLPWFGGGPSVWTTCLLFFQTVLLGGYVYAHWLTSRLPPRRQAWVHGAVLVLALVALPIIPSAHWKPTGHENPISHILLLLAATVGVPYFALSATGPLMQQWFSRVRPGESPYRLYALSNAGSLLALIGYPFFFEQVYSRQTQALLWSAGLGAFAVGAAVCAWQRVKARGASGIVGAVVPSDLSVEPFTRPATPLDRLLWFSLAAVASLLLLATTNKLCQDLAVIPFLWVLPLGLYLLSFILCFDHPRWYSRKFFSAWFAAGALVDVYLLFAGHVARLPQQVIGLSTTLFAGCMLCHGELYRIRPEPRQLTSFYLYIAAGGAVGAFVVAVLAPLVFDRYLELHLALLLLSYLVGVLAFRDRSVSLAWGTAVGAMVAAFLVPVLTAVAKKEGRSFGAAKDALISFHGEHWPLLLLLVAAVAFGFAGRKGVLRKWQMRAGHFVMLFCVTLGALLIVQVRRDTGKATMTSRDFYGVLKVFEHNPEDPDLHYTTLVHGVTSHGLQFVSAPQSTWPTSYYAETSGVGLAIESLPPLPRRNLGVVGLGTGTLASYGRVGDHVRIYEIDPQVERVARSHFTYLEHSPAQVEVVLGDARLSLERELAAGQSQQFDVLALDAFSSDAIPVHLLTVEAFATYLRHLKPDGTIAVHTSNRYLDLEPVVKNLADHFNLQSVVISDSPPSKKWWVFRTTWILVTRNEALLQSAPVTKAREEAEPSTRTVGLFWTDDHASVFQILK